MVYNFVCMHVHVRTYRGWGRAWGNTARCTLCTTAEAIVQYETMSKIKKAVSLGYKPHSTFK